MVHNEPKTRQKMTVDGNDDRTEWYFALSITFYRFLHLRKTFPNRHPKSRNLTRISDVEYFAEDKQKKNAAR